MDCTENKLDCPICFEQITKETGQVTTSCSHTFHFKCLNTWYWQQAQGEDSKESCPCCRKEPGEYELASTIPDESDKSEQQEYPEYDSDEEIERSNPYWIRTGPGHWIMANSENERLQILAQVAEDERKRHQFDIPEYNAEAHALWQLRHLFEEPVEPATQQERKSFLDRPKHYRRRRVSFGRTFYCHLGTEYKLDMVDGYKTD